MENWDSAKVGGGKDITGRRVEGFTKRGCLCRLGGGTCASRCAVLKKENGMACGKEVEGKAQEES